MVLSLVIFVLLLSCVVESSSGGTSSEWELWKATYSKSYLTLEEERYRRDTWEENSLLIKAHNTDSDKHGYTLEMNSFGDLVSYYEISMSIFILAVDFS